MRRISPVAQVAPVVAVATAAIRQRSLKLRKMDALKASLQSVRTTSSANKIVFKLMVTFFNDAK
jgi:hypothetical protein